MKTLSLLIDIVLILGLFLALNESSTFVPNFIGLACFVALIYKHRNDVNPDAQL